MDHDPIALIVYSLQRDRDAQPHAVRQVQFDLLELGIGLEDGALRLILMVEHDVVPIHDVNVAVIVDRHAPQLVDYEVEIDLDADHAGEFLIDIDRRHVRDHIRICCRIDVRLDPRRAFTLKRNIIPADVLIVVGREECKVGDLPRDKFRQRSFPAGIFTRHEETALRPAEFGRQMQVISDATVRPARNIVEALFHGGEIFGSIGGVGSQPFITFGGVDRLTLHAVDCLSNAEECSIQSFPTDDAHGSK